MQLWAHPAQLVRSRDLAHRVAGTTTNAVTSRQTSATQIGRVNMGVMSPLELISPARSFFSIRSPKISPRITGANGTFFASKKKPIRPNANMTYTSKRLLRIANEPTTEKTITAVNKVLRTSFGASIDKEKDYKLKQ